MKFKVLYILFIVSALLYGSWQIAGPLTMRHLFAGIMGIWCIFESKDLFFDKYLRLYFVFVFFYALSSFLTGYTIEFLHDFVGYVVVAYIAYWATMILKRKYGSLHVLVYTVIAIGLIDSIVTTSQAFHLPIFDSLLARLRLTVDDEWFVSKQVREIDMMGVSIPGIFEGAVINGHFLVMSVLMSLSLQRYRVNIGGYIITAILFIGLFFCQQRAPFYLCIFLFGYIFYKTYVSGRDAPMKIVSWLVLVTIGVVSIVYLSPLLFSTGVRYSESISISEDARGIIYRNTIDWIIEHPLGNLYDLKQVKMPHNLFLNAFVYGGWIGGGLILIVLFGQLLLIAKILFKPTNPSNFFSIVLAVTYLGMTGNSMVHNISIVTGDAMTWIAWAAFYANVWSGDQTMKGWTKIL